MKCSRKPFSENKIKIGGTQIESVSVSKYPAAEVNPINAIQEKKESDASGNWAFSANKELFTINYNLERPN